MASRLPPLPWAVLAKAVLWVTTLLIGSVIGGAWNWWRSGEVVATASFDPGVAPYTLEVREVPVPVTNSGHLIVSLNRGRYVVTSHRFFWEDYTPETVEIDWPRKEHFTVTFDDRYVASCDWRSGRSATWSLQEKEE